MKTVIASATFFLAALAAPGHAIDFTPQTLDSIDDGVPIRRMYFTDGARKIFYRPPAHWSKVGDHQGVTFTPKGSERAMVLIRNSPPNYAGIPFDASGLKRLRSLALTMVPPNAVEVKEIWEAVNPVVLQGWTSFEIGLDYVQSGRHYCRSILFINLDAKRQIHFIVDALPDEFRPLYKTTYRTLATWWEPTDRTVE